MDHILAALESLQSLTVPLEVIVVDNASRDGSPEAIERSFPLTQLIRSPDNVGFGRACNLGVSASRGRFILLLNYDARLLEGLKEALGHLDVHPAVGILGGRLIYPDGRPQPSFGYSHTPARVVLSWLNIPGFSREVRSPGAYLVGQQEVAWVSGALLLARRTVWEALDGMDPGFFLYLEDVDFCERARSAGFRIDYLPWLLAIHDKTSGAKALSRVALLSTVDSYHRHFQKKYGPMVARLTSLALAATLTLRAAATACLRHDPVRRREPRTLLEGALRSLRWGCWKPWPWGYPR